jgi:hypothetical protein
MRRSIAWAAATLGPGALLAVLVLADDHSSLRGLLALWFMLLGPGMAYVPLIGLENRVTELVMATAVSISANMILSLALAYLDIWSAERALAFLMAVCTAGFGIQIVKAARLGPASGKARGGAAGLG